MTADLAPSAFEHSGQATSGEARAASSEQAEAILAVEAEFGELMTKVRRITNEMAERVSPGLNPGAYKVFTTIVRDGPIKASDMTERMALDKGQLSRTLRELQDLGLIARTPDPGDRRASLLEATPFGVERLTAARSGTQTLLHNSLLAWDVDRVRDLATLLRALTDGTAPDPR
ncbi:MarR family transcriptional regulator [Microbacterium oryzae]|uniref:MarR family winged helix-turn-helix transcriptional regulator n=1 Tax=Microbacterium oryzae TaxID=743009 RepID=UPI0025B00D20|nr:MarR family transcriptional regulator [Microbacterium oryzae]MDN3311109.1 MarR family transcriptional regulator [Microbacterium oryzae]